MLLPWYDPTFSDINRLQSTLVLKGVSEGGRRDLGYESPWDPTQRSKTQEGPAQAHSSR
jgi:hypothetical protein